MSKPKKPKAGDAPAIAHVEPETFVASEVPPGGHEATAAPAPEPVPVEQAKDAGLALYRDRSAPPRGEIITEGKANFETVTKAARGESDTSET